MRPFLTVWGPLLYTYVNVGGTFQKTPIHTRNNLQNPMLVKTRFLRGWSFLKMVKIIAGVKRCTNCQGFTVSPIFTLFERIWGIIPTYSEPQPGREPGTCGSEGMCSTRVTHPLFWSYSKSLSTVIHMSSFEHVFFFKAIASLLLVSSFSLFSRLEIVSFFIGLME